MKKAFLTTLAIAAVLSCTACGNTEVGPADQNSAAKKPVTTNVTSSLTEAAEYTTEISQETTGSEAELTTSETTLEEETTTSEAVAAGGEAPTNTETPTNSNAPSNNSAPAEDNIKTVAPSPEDADYAPAPQKYDIEGITYIQGALIANKSYSLPADFAPGLDPTCENQFYKMTSAASKQGLYIYFASGYRSYDLQSRLYNDYVARDGQALADTYSARPGHSEHQSGLAIDVNSIDDSFAVTPEAKWLADHCHEYGFILRYPKGKEDITGYQYESWHVRYVGTDLSYAIRNSGLTMEEYFGIDSKYKD